MKTLMLASVAAFLAVGSPTFAQSVPEKTGVNSSLGIAPKTQDFVTEAAQSDMLEIESSKLAVTKTDSAKTKAFAERMVKDHTETSTELKGLVTGGKVQLVVPAGTPDGAIFDAYTVLGGELELEDGRVLTFQIQDGAVGAQVAVLADDEHDRGVGLSSIPDVPGGV